MSKQKIFLDVDNTITNSTKAFAETYNYIYKNNPNFTPAQWEQIEQYNMRDQCRLLSGSPEVLELFEHHIFFKKLQFINDNTYDVIKKLNDKYKIIIVSIGTPSNLARKSEWLKNNLPFLKDYILIYNGDCQMDKSIVDMSNGIQIDDVSSNIITSNAERKICFGREYIWNYNWLGERCFDWTEVEKELL